MKQGDLPRGWDGSSIPLGVESTRQQTCYIRSVKRTLVLDQQPKNLHFRDRIWCGTFRPEYSHNMSEPVPSDEELLPRLCGGDEAAYATLVRRYHGRMQRLARTFVRTQAAADEVVQDAWLAVLQGIDRFEQRSSFKVWLFQILTNRAKSYGEREGRSTPFSALGSDDDAAQDALNAQFAANGHWLAPPPQWDGSTPEKLLLRRETQQVLEEAIRLLPPAQRAVLIMKDVEGLDADEICKIIDLSEGNQRVLLHRARTSVRLVLDKHLALK